MNEKNKALDVKVIKYNNFKKETVQSENILEETLSELRSIELIDKKEALMGFKCVFRDMKYKSAVECSQHVR